MKGVTKSIGPVLVVVLALVVIICFMSTDYFSLHQATDTFKGGSTEDRYMCTDLDTSTFREMLSTDPQTRPWITKILIVHNEFRVTGMENLELQLIRDESKHCYVREQEGESIVLVFEVQGGSVRVPSSILFLFL